MMTNIQQSLSYTPEPFEKMVIALNSIAAPKMDFIHYGTTLLLERNQQIFIECPTR